MLRRYWNEWSEGLGSLFFPPICEACGIGLPTGRLCRPCLTLLTDPPDVRLCPRCAGTVGPFVPVDDGCDLCRDDRFAFTQVDRLGRFDDALRQAVYRIKDPNEHRLAIALADQLVERCASRWQCSGIDMIVAIPLHWRRRWGRGYDQARCLAEQISRRMKVAGAPRSLVRQRSTTSQARLSPTQRRVNVKDAFRCRRPSCVAGRNILLVDDVLTTGATAHECARILRAAGARSVRVAVIARGDHRPNAYPSAPGNPV